MDDSDKQILSGMLTKYYRFFLGAEQEKQWKAEIEARIALSNAKMADFASAFKLFGFGPMDQNMWNEISNAIGFEAFSQAIDEGRRLYHGILATQADPQISNYTEPKTEQVEQLDKPLKLSSTDRPNIKAILLALLEAKGPEGDGATSLRTQIESIHPITLHEKTVGMTLYRLSKEGLVRRNGRTWFFVPKITGTKNPGAETPGATSLLDEKGGTDA